MSARARPWLREGCSVYVGDHVHDVEGALAAGATSVSVLTGGCTREELLAAGTHVVLDDLTEFPEWLEDHLLATRLAALDADLRDRGSVLVAYSGGADSALLLAAAVRTLGADRVVAATGYSDSLPAGRARPGARVRRVARRPRCSLPRRTRWTGRAIARTAGSGASSARPSCSTSSRRWPPSSGLEHVATGTNADDVVAGFRPGIRAAAERGAITPLADAGLTKSQVRAASRAWSLPTWDKPQAACLSSRIAYGIEVTPHRLARVERAEAAVREEAAALGVPLRDLRVRDLGDHASLELDAGVLPLDADVEAAVLSRVREAGFERAQVDPRGFRSGSLNDLL